MKLNFKKSGSGPPLVILHGLFGSLDNWFSIAKELVENYTLYLVDQRNHGDSPHAEEWNYAVMVEDLKEMLDAEGLDKIYLMGHSMGGAGALYLGPKYVDQWAAVASMAPAAFLMNPDSLAPVKDKMPLLLAHGDAELGGQVATGADALRARSRGARVEAHLIERRRR